MEKENVPFQFVESFELVGASGPKTFVKGTDSIVYASVHLREDGQILEVKADPSYDFSKYIGQKVNLLLELKKGSVVRVLSFHSYV